MALTGFMQSGFYTVLSITNYDKHIKSIQIQTQTFKDSSKEILLTENSFEFMGNLSYTEVIAIQNTPPGSPSLGDRYIVGTSPTGDWVGMENQHVIWKDDLSGNPYWQAGIDQQVWNLADSKCYKQLSDNTWIEDKGAFDAHTFDQWFTITELDILNQNLLERAYEYLKTRPEFAGTTDA